MNRNYFITVVVLVFVCILFIFVTMWKFQEVDKPLVSEQLVPHPLSPYKSSLSASGVVEPSSENIYLSTPLNRNISKVLVKVGTNVKKGEALIELENNDIKADLKAQLSAYAIAFAKLEKLKKMPRAEDLASAQAQEKVSQALYSQAKAQYEMVQKLTDPRAISQEERNKRQFDFEQAEAKLEQAQADLKKIKAGTWAPDLKIAQMEVKQAKSNLEKIKADLEQTIIRSPIDGTVLQVLIHSGELPSADKNPLMVIGDINNMFIRASINQFDIPYFNPKSDAVAFLQGDARYEFPLEYVRTEPYLVDKQNVRNNILERVDTKVLQVVYKIKSTNKKNLYVGQEMDVFIDEKSIKGTQ